MLACSRNVQGHSLEYAFNLCIHRSALEVLPLSIMAIKVHACILIVYFTHGVLHAAKLQQLVLELFAPADDIVQMKPCT